ncbi:uncharacterized protein LOC113039485 [Carassius auratus]|uniref:Uncharacterized protein LOC113039485 n=1 Tax=Carassius auratus TaxID=7957 RepID=A0A6P6J0U0_CARAU|nr:uncharacterized protein LOC113039485 [Carassius auratus]
MKEMFKIFTFVLLICGVFGADEDEVKSVMEGDSVTLNLDPTQIQGFIQIQWRFGKLGSTIAKIVGKTISYEDEEIFEDCLQLDQTGSLTIKNMRTKHSGRYKAEISHSTGTLDIIFIVTVFVSPDVIDAVKGEMKLMSVTEGDPVILQTDVPQLTRDMLVVWRSGDEGKLIAKHDIEAKSSPFYVETDGRFRDRLKLDQTGSLTITNSRTNDSGLYRVKISSNNQTTYKRFTVTVSVPDSGLSGGAVAGIVIVLLLLVQAVAGVMYFFRRPITTKLPNQTWIVQHGDHVTLNPETEIQRGDEIQWLFGAEETLIAEIKGENREMKTHEGPDERFRDRLKLETTGSLTIKFIFTKHSGLFTLKIRRGRETLYKRFNVYVKSESLQSV